MQNRYISKAHVIPSGHRFDVLRTRLSRNLTIRTQVDNGCEAPGLERGNIRQLNLLGNENFRGQLIDDNSRTAISKTPCCSNQS